MDFFDYFKSIFQIAPAPAAIIVVAWFYFKSKKKTPNDFVNRSECHSHIDGLKGDINIRLSEIKDEIKELRGFLVNALNKAD